MRVKQKSHALNALRYTEEFPTWPIDEFPRPVFVEKDTPLALLAWTDKVSYGLKLHVFFHEQPILKELYLLADKDEDDWYMKFTVATDGAGESGTCEVRFAFLVGETCE
jgi:hypothetical protein